MQNLSSKMKRTSITCIFKFMAIFTHGPVKQNDPIFQRMQNSHFIHQCIIHEMNIRILNEFIGNLFANCGEC